MVRGRFSLLAGKKALCPKADGEPSDQTSRRFVEDEQLRIGEQSSDKSQPPFHSTGERSNLSIAFVIQRHVFQQFFDPPKRVFHTLKPRIKPHVFQDGQFLVESVLLRNHADPLFDAPSVSNRVKAENPEIAA